MLKINLLLENTPCRYKKIKVKNKKAVYVNHIKDRYFTGRNIRDIIDFINNLHDQHRKIKIPIEFHLGEIEMIDKLTYTLFECLCYYLIECGHEVQIYLNNHNSILTEGMASSPLLLLNNTSKNTIKKYPEKFRYDLFRGHFRKIVTKGKAPNYLGQLYAEIDSFLKPFRIKKTTSEDISLVVTELVGNVEDHTGEPCLLDIDITHPYEKNSTPDKKYYGINIVILNFSEILLGDGIKKKIQNKIMRDERYLNVTKAFEYHKKNFNEYYSEEDFYNITTFQDEISGRLNYDTTGGTGLTKLINSLEKRSDMHRCYVVSGNRCLKFLEGILDMDTNRWIGFNKTHDYFTSIPENDVICESYIYFPGTAYNLNFVMESEEF